MTASQWLGLALLASPFIVVFAFMVWAGGWRLALGVYAVTAAVVAICMLGTHLLSGGNW